MKTSSLLTIAALSATPVFAQADECVNATDLGTGSTSAAFDTNVASDTGTLATTSGEQQCISLSDDVWFKYTAAMTGLATFDTCNNSTMDTEIGVWEGSDCSTFVGLGCNDDNFGAGCTGATSLITVPVTAGETYYVQIGHWDATDGNTYGAGTLTITEAPDPCTTTPDDTLEENDTCPAAVALAAGTYTGLFASNSDADFYAITIPAGEELIVDVVTTSGFADQNIYDSSCSLLTTGGFYPNLTGAPLTVTAEVAWAVGNADTCFNYDLTVTTQPVACGTTDAFEPNSDCSTAAAITAGSYTGLNLYSVDQDYYSISVPAGATIDASITFIDDDGDLDLYLWDPLTACDTNVEGTGDFVGALDVGFGITDLEEVTYENLTGATQNLILEVDVFFDGECNDYDLNISIDTGMVGTTFCPGIANTTGVVGVAAYVGSLSVTDNNATLTAMNLPPNQFGIFVTSETIVPPFAVADGELCLSGNIGRYQQQSQIWGSGPTGNDGMLAIDLTAIPSTGPLLSAMAGETRGFQGWFRDAGPLGANFTTGISVTFTP